MKDTELLPYKIHGCISKHVDATVKVYIIFEHPSYMVQFKCCIWCNLNAVYHIWQFDTYNYYHSLVIDFNFHQQLVHLTFKKFSVYFFNNGSHDQKNK